MAAYQSKVLLAPTVIATSTTTTYAPTRPNQIGSATLPAHANQLVMQTIVSAYTDGTYTATLQHSPDNVNWYTLVAATAISSATSNLATVASTVTILPYVQLSLVSSGVTTGATVNCILFYGEQRKNGSGGGA